MTAGAYSARYIAGYSGRHSADGRDLYTTLRIGRRGNREFGVDRASIAFAGPAEPSISRDSWRQARHDKRHRHRCNTQYDSRTNDDGGTCGLWHSAGERSAAKICESASDRSVGYPVGIARSVSMVGRKYIVRNARHFCDDQPRFAAIVLLWSAIGWSAWTVRFGYWLSGLRSVPR